MLINTFRQQLIWMFLNILTSSMMTKQGFFFLRQAIKLKLLIFKDFHIMKTYNSILDESLYLK